MKVFIVDDEIELQDIYKGMLKGTGWEVVTASSALQISPGPKDVVVLDLNGTHSRLFALSSGRILTISGTSRFGVDLEKPFSKQDFISAIKKKAG